MNIEQKVRETISKYELLNKKEKVVVALSGGKDSTSILFMLHKFGYNVSGLMIDLHLGEWSRKNRKNMEGFCSELGIKLEIVDMKKEFGHGICFIKDVVKKRKGLTGCSVCGIVKKWILNKWARKVGADKIVTGHNLDDEAQTVLMNFLKGNVYLGVGAGPEAGLNRGVGAHPNAPSRSSVAPTLSKDGGSKLNKLGVNEGGEIIDSKPKFVQRIKPLFFVPEDEIRKYSKKRKLPVLYERCPCAFGTYRVETREWFDKIGLSGGGKLKIVGGWLKVAKGLGGKEVREIKECEVCGEPSSGDVCNACGIWTCLTEM